MTRSDGPCDRRFRASGVGDRRTSASGVAFAALRRAAGDHAAHADRASAAASSVRAESAVPCAARPPAAAACAARPPAAALRRRPLRARAPPAPPTAAPPTTSRPAGRAAARGAAARSSRPTPRTRSAGPARARGTPCAPDTSGRSSRASRWRAPFTNNPSASAVRHRAAARQFRLPGIPCPPRPRPLLALSGSATPTDGSSEPAVPPNTRQIYSIAPEQVGSVLAIASPRAVTVPTPARVPWSIVKPPRHLLRPVGLLLGLCVLAGVLVAGMAFPGAFGAGDGVQRGRRQCEQRVDGSGDGAVAADVDDHGFGGGADRVPVRPEPRPGGGGRDFPGDEGGDRGGRGSPVLPASGRRLAGHDPGGGGELGVG